MPRDVARRDPRQDTSNKTRVLRPQLNRATVVCAVKSASSVEDRSSISTIRCPRDIFTFEIEGIDVAHDPIVRSLGRIYRILRINRTRDFSMTNDPTPSNGRNVLNRFHAPIVWNQSRLAPFVSCRSGEAGEAPLAGEQFLHRALLDLALLGDEFL